MTKESRIDRESLLYGGDTAVPGWVAVCPECGQKLHAECQQWVEESGIPTMGGVHVYCTTDPFSLRHRHWQGDWQQEVDAVHNWCGAVLV